MPIAIGLGVGFYPSFYKGGAVGPPIIPTNLVYRLKADYGITSSGGRISSMLPYPGSGITDASTQAVAGNQPFTGVDNQLRPTILMRSPTNCWLELPATVVLDARNFTCYCVRRDWRGNDAVLLDSSSYTGSLLSSTSVSNTTGCYYSASTRSNTSVRYYNNIDVSVVASDASVVKFWNSLVSGVGAGAMGVGTGINNLRMGEFSQVEVYDLLIYSGKHTDLQVATNIASLAALYPDIRTTPWTKQFVATGDSITNGNAPGGNNAAWPGRLCWDYMSGWRCTNRGSSGSTALEEVVKKPALNWLADPTMAHDVLVVAVGRNDMGTSGGFLTPAQAYANLVSLIQGYKADVPTRDVWAGTLIRTNNSANDPTDDAYNSSIKGGIVADAGAAGYIDFQSGPMATWQAANMFDTNHPNDNGAVYMAQTASTRLLAAYGP